MDYRAQLTTLARSYAKAAGLSVARVATLAVNHGGFFDRIEAGGSCSVDMYLKVKAWFADHWPEGAPWPAGVDRPGVLPANATPRKRRAA